MGCNCREKYMLEQQQAANSERASAVTQVKETLKAAWENTQPAPTHVVKRINKKN